MRPLLSAQKAENPEDGKAVAAMAEAGMVVVVMAVVAMEGAPTAVGVKARAVTEAAAGEVGG